MMEIDVKKEQERVEGEMKVIVDGFNQRVQQITALQKENQELTNQLLKKQGELEWLERMNGKKET